MTGGPGEADGAGRRRPGAGPTGVLADRIAATLTRHEPGWRLPRLTALARRYHVGMVEIDAAIDELAARHLLRRMPDGQVYRASPAEYRLPLEGIVGFTSHVDPMGGTLACRERQVSRRRPPEGVGRSLGLAPGEPVLAIRCLWTVGGEPGAMSASYLPERLGEALRELTAPPFGSAPGARRPLDGEPEPPASARAAGQPAAAGEGVSGQPGAVQIEVAPPPPSVARSLRLSAGEPVVAVTVRFEDPGARAPVALTVAMLRPDLFRVVVQAQAGVRTAGLDGFASAWTQAASDWEP